jgi:hypothetical protein
MVISALVHPLLFVTIGWLAYTIATAGASSLLQPALIAIDFANIMLGYTAYFLLGRSTLPPGKRRGLWTVALFTPVYWCMQSVAAWRAVWQLRRDPHLCGLMYQKHQSALWGTLEWRLHMKCLSGQSASYAGNHSLHRYRRLASFRSRRRNGVPPEHRRIRKRSRLERCPVAMVARHDQRQLLNIPALGLCTSYGCRGNALARCGNPEIGFELPSKLHATS